MSSWKEKFICINFSSKLGGKKVLASLFLSSCSSSCLNWVSCSCYSTDVSHTKKPQSYTVDFHSSGFKSQFWLHYKQRYPTPSPTDCGCSTSAASQANVTLQQRWDQEAHIEIFQFSHRFHGFRSGAPLNVPEEPVPALLEHAISYIPSYCRFSALYHERISLKALGPWEQFSILFPTHIQHTNLKVLLQNLLM